MINLNSNASHSVNNSVNTGAVSGATSRANTTVSTSVAGRNSVSISTAFAIGLICLAVGGSAGVAIARLYYGHRAGTYVYEYNKLINRLKNLENDMKNE